MGSQILPDGCLFFAINVELPHQFCPPLRLGGTRVESGGSGQGEKGMGHHKPKAPALKPDRAGARSRSATDAPDILPIPAQPGLNAKEYTVSLAWEFLIRTRDFLRQSHQEFGDRLFLPNLPPEAPENRRRFNAYVADCLQGLELLGKAISLVSITSSMAEGTESLTRGHLDNPSVEPVLRSRKRK